MVVEDERQYVVDASMKSPRPGRHRFYTALADTIPALLARPLRVHADADAVPGQVKGETPQKLERH